MESAIAEAAALSRQCRQRFPSSGHSTRRARFSPQLAQLPQPENPEAAEAILPPLDPHFRFEPTFPF